MARVSKEEYLPLVTSWKMVADYEDGERLYFYGDSEEDCMEEILEQEERCRRCTWYSGCSDEDYEAGEYIGRENFKYDQKEIHMTGSTIGKLGK